MLLQELITKFGFNVEHKPLEKLEHTLERVHGKLEFLAAAEIVKGLFELAERFAGMGEQLETAALQAGVTAEKFQELAYAASQNAVSQGEFSGALARLARTLQHAKNGSEQAEEIFGRIGIAPDQIQSFQTTQEAFYAIQDAIKGIDDPIKRLAATQELFGRGSSKLVKLLSKGSDETKRLQGEAVRIGAVLSDQGVENLATFEDAFSGFKQVANTALAQIGAAAAPVFTHIIHQVENFWAANQRLIKQDFRRWGMSAAYAFGFVFGAIQITAEVLAKFIRQHPQLVENMAKVIGSLIALSLATGGFKLLLGGVRDMFEAVRGVASIGMPVMSAFFKVGVWGAGKLASLLGTILLQLGYAIASRFPALGNAIFSIGSKLLVLSANPIFLTIAGVVAALTATFVILHDIWALMHGKSFGETWLGEGLEMLKDKGGSALQNIKNLISGGFGGGEAVPGSATSDPMSMFTQLGGMPGAQGMPMPDFGTGALQGLAQTAVPLAAGLGAGAGVSAVMPGESTVNYSINSPITINVPPGANATDIARMAKQAAQEVWDKGVREAQRNHAPMATR